MPDNLTLEFKRQLEERTKLSTQPPTSNLKAQAGGSLWQSAKGKELPTWMTERIDDEETSMLAALGKGAWTALDISLVGVPGLIGRSISDDFAATMEPKTFGERVATGIGGAAGFLIPMSKIRTALNFGTKVFASSGVKKFAQSYSDDAIKLMRQDKNFMKWVSKKVNRGEIEAGEEGINKFLGSLVQDRKATLETLGTRQGEAMFARTAKNRMNFAKNFNDSTPKVLMDKLEGAGFTGRNATNLVNTLGDDLAKKIGTVVDDAGATFKFPMTQLNQVLAGHMGSGKLGNLAAHAVEEAIMFSAVELPLNFMNSLANDEVDFSFTGTLGHAFALGSVLGVVRFIPGGSDYGIIRPAWNRITKTLQTRRRYGSYNVTDEADRLFLGEEAKRMFSMKKKPLNRLRKTVQQVKGKSYKTPINTKTDIDDLVKTAKGAQTVKDALIDIERALYKSWYPKFLKEIPGDLIGSSGRMLAGALAFNWTGIEMMSQDGYPLEDIIFNVALGMFMTKKGKPFEYTNRSTGKVEHIFDDRPYTYTKELEDVDTWLNMTNTALDASLYRALYNEHTALRRGFAGADETSKDMQKLREIAEKHGLFVEKYVSEDAEGNRETREKKAAKTKAKIIDENGKEVEKEVDIDETFTDEVYNMFAGILDLNLKPKDTEYEVLDTYELSPKKLASIKKDLRAEKFDALQELKTEGKRGIETQKDLVDVVLGSSENQAIRYREIAQNTLIDVYNKVYEVLYGDKDYRPLESDAFNTMTDRIKLQPLDFEDSTLVLPDRVYDIIGPDSFLMKTVSPYVSTEGKPIRLNQKMIDAIFGKFKEGQLTEPGLLEEHDRILTEMTFDTAIETIPAERWMRVGNDMVSNWTNLVLNKRATRQHWRAIQDLNVEAKNKNNIFDKADYPKIQNLVTDVFNELGELADVIHITKAGKILDGKDAGREYNFVNKMLSVLRNDFTRKTAREKITKQATIANVQDLMKLVDKSLPIFTMPSGTPKNDLVNQIADYTLDRSIANFNKTSPEGKSVPLDGVDRNVVKYLLDHKIVTPQMTMLNIKGVIDTNLARMLDFFNQNKSEIEKVGDEVAFAALLKSDPSLFHQVSGAIGQTEFLKEISAAAEGMNMSFGEFISNMYEGLNKNIYPLIRESDKKGGFIHLDTRPESKAFISAPYLIELGMTIDAMKESSARMSHQELYDATTEMIRIGKYNFAKNSTEHNTIHSLMNNIMNLYLSRPSTASIALKTLVKAKLFDRADNQFKFEDTDKNLIERIREAEDTMNFMFQVTNSDRDLRVMWERDRLDGESRYPVDSPVTIGLNKYISRYNIKLDAMPGSTLGMVIKEDANVMKNAYNFYEFMRSQGAVLTFGSNKVQSNKWGLRQYNQKHEKFIHDTLMVYSQLKNSVTVNRISAYGTGNPRHSQSTFQKNDLYNVVKDILGEFTLISTDFVKSGRKYNISLDSVDHKIKSEFFSILATKPAIAQEGYGHAMDVQGDLVGQYTKRPYAVAFVSNMKDGIGIPLDFLGENKYHGINRVVKEFVTIVDKRIEEMGDYMHPDAISTYNDWKRTALKEVERKVGDEVITELVYQEGDMNHQRISEDMTMMINNIFGDKAQGREYWESVSNENWNNAELFAKKQLRYMKLLSNRTSKPITEEYINEAIDLLERVDDKNLKLFRFLGNDVVGEAESIKSELKKLSKGWKVHILGDESPTDGEAPPAISSLFQSLSKQIIAENDAYFDAAKGELLDLKDFNTENLSMPGGLGDVSRFDSVNIVSKKKMAAIKFLIGLHNTNIEHLKAVGASSSDTDAVFLDKTAWITDTAWDKYLENNKIDIVIMDSANKMSGTGVTGKKSPEGASEKIIYMDKFNSMSELMSHISDADKIVNLPTDTFSIASAVKSEKSSTIPLQVANDLDTPELNSVFYDWMLERGVRDFIKDANKTFGDGAVSEIASKMQINFDELDIETDQMSLFERWISSGGDPTFLPFKRTVRNSIKRQLIDKRNLFTPRNEHGSQSIVVPDFSDYESPNYLRNTLFKTEWLNGERTGNAEDIVSRDVWTYGQIEIDASNIGKRVDTDRVRFIEHNKSGKDRIVTLDDIPNNEKIKSLLKNNNVVLGQLHRALEGSEIVYRVIKGVDMYEHTSLKSPDGDLRDIWIVDSKEKAYDQLHEMRDRAIMRRENFWFAENLTDIKKGGEVVGWKLKDNKVVAGKKRGDDKYIYLRENAPKEIKVDESRQSGMEYYGKEFEQGVQSKDTRYEIALVAHRTPTTRSSDKVIVGLKGFGDLTGNAARINHADGWFRLEMDFDLDKLNYWWDTPESILKFWDKKAGDVPSIKGEQSRSSIEGLNPFNGRTLMDYNFSEANSSLYRGIVVKARNTVQFLKTYTGANYDDVKGFNIKLDRGRIVLSDEKTIQNVEALIAKDIQRIVDASGRGYDKAIFNNEWENKILFGDGKEYPGLFSKQSYNQSTKEWVTSKGELDTLHRDMITLALRPYKRFMQLRTSIFESGEQKRVDYDTLIDYTQRFSYTMSNLSRAVYWGLRKGRGPSKQEHSGDDINAIFKNAKGEFIDPFRLRDARFDKSVSGEDASNQNFRMIATDRMIANIAGMDRMTMKKIEPAVQNKIDEFAIQFLLGDTADVSAATKKIVESFDSDFDKLNAINGIDYRMRRYRRSQRRMEANGNHDLAQSFAESYNRLRDLKLDITKEVMMRKSVQKAVRSRVVRQIYRTLAQGGKWTDKYGSTHDFSHIKSRSKRFKAINKIKPQITASIWDVKNKRLGLSIRGVNSDDYAQILATYNVLSQLTSVGLNPATVERPTAIEWESDIRQFRGNYGSKWWKFFNNKLTDDMDANSIMNESIIELEQLYYKWEGDYPGLGKQFVMSIMTPQISTGTVTYHKGSMMPGFDRVHSQAKFITLGLRFFERLNTNMSQGLMNEIAKPISNQLAWLRGEADPNFQLNDVDLKNYRALTFEDSEGGSPLIEYDAALRKKVDELATQLSTNKSLPAALSEWKDMEEINKDVFETLGLTGDISLDYISYKLPNGGLDLIASLGALTEIRRIPNNAITRSGKIVPVHGINSYFRHKMNQVRMFYGQPKDTKNLFTGRKERVAGDIYGGYEYLEKNKEALKRTTNRHVNEEGEC